MNRFPPAPWESYPTPEQIEAEHAAAEDKADMRREDEAYERAMAKQQPK